MSLIPKQGPTLLLETPSTLPPTPVEQQKWLHGRSPKLPFLSPRVQVLTLWALVLVPGVHLPTRSRRKPPMPPVAPVTAPLSEQLVQASQFTNRFPLV